MRFNSGFKGLIVISELRAKYCAVAFRWMMTASFRRKKKKCANCCHKYCRRNLTSVPFSQRQWCQPVIMSPSSNTETYVRFPSTKTIVSVLVQTHNWPDTCRNPHHHYHHQYTRSISKCVKGKGHPLTCLCRRFGGGGRGTIHSQPRHYKEGGCSAPRCGHITHYTRAKTRCPSYKTLVGCRRRFGQHEKSRLQRDSIPGRSCS
jgi:hypothetical protein